MKMRKITYCELKFLLTFLDEYQPTIQKDDIQLLKSWIDLYGFLEKADLIIDTSEKEYLSLCKRYKRLEELWKKSTEAENRLLFQKEKFIYLEQLNSDNLKDEYLNAIYLSTCNDAICREKSNQYGIIAVNNNTALNCKHFYKDCGASLPKNEAGDWSFMMQINKVFPQLRNCNSLILVDKYVFTDSGEKFTFKDKINSNLKPIFDFILPEKLVEGLEFELIIITGERYKDFKTQYEYLCSKIKEIRPNLACRITMYNCNKYDFHDRSIATNNVWIDCPHGFDLFKPGQESATSATKVLIAFPLIQQFSDQVDKSYITLAKDVREIMYRTPKDGLYTYGEKHPKNRLVAHYTKRPVVDVTLYKVGDKIDVSILERNKRRKKNYF